MISLSNKDCDKQLEFECLLRNANEFLNEAAKSDRKTYLSLNGTSLEKVAADAMRKCCSGTSFKQDDVKILSGQNFPDIITSYSDDPRYFGVEVKTTKENRWISTGSSIVESSRHFNVDQIYMLFGKLANPCAEFRTRKYEECLYDITVTHSPRYLINMELSENENIFVKMRTTYDEFRTSPDNIDKARSFYRQLAHEKEEKTGVKELPWWLKGDGKEGVRADKIVDITLYSKLSENMKIDLKSKGFILFYEDILSNKSDKYESTVLWFCERYSVLVHNARDLYTAGGQGFIPFKGKAYGPYPKVILSLINYKDHIKNILRTPTLEFKEDIQKYWGCTPTDNIYEEWVSRISNFMNAGSKYKSIPISEFLK